MSKKIIGFLLASITSILFSNMMVDALFIEAGIDRNIVYAPSVQQEAPSTPIEELPGEMGEIQPVLATPEPEKVEEKKETSTKEVKTAKTSTTPKKDTTKKTTTEKKATTSTVGSFESFLTHYGPDCAGCGGTTAAGYNVRNTIYYNDKTYGQVRIVAASKELPLYSIIKIGNYKKGAITAIVLDRGGAIKGTRLDILVSSEKEASQLGIQRGAKVEILRRGK